VGSRHDWAQSKRPKFDMIGPAQLKSGGRNELVQYDTLTDLTLSKLVPCNTLGRARA